jgi:integrase/recombinase XerD
MTFSPGLVRSLSSAGGPRFALGDPLVDSYLAFVAGRARANTLRAIAHDLKTFFSVVGKDPAEVVAADVFEFVAHQRGDRRVIRISDGESGLSARTIARRLSSISGLYAYLVARGDTPVRTNPVPRGLSTRRRGGRRQHVPLVRVPRTLPKIRSPAEVKALVAALRTDRDRAMVFAMVLGGLRRCEVLGLRLGDVQVAERSLFIAEGKGGHQRVIPIPNVFFAAVGDYLGEERPRDTETDRVFVTLKGPTRGRPHGRGHHRRALRRRCPPCRPQRSPGPAPAHHGGDRQDRGAVGRARAHRHAGGTGRGADPGAPRRRGARRRRHPGGVPALCANTGATAASPPC